MAELITTENLSKELLKSILDAAFMETSYDKDGDLRIQENVRCFVLPNENSRDRIRLLTLFGFNDSCTEIQRLQCANRINSEYVVVRATVSNDALLFDYDLLINDGLSQKAFVLAVKRFCSIPRSAVSEYGTGLID